MTDPFKDALSMPIMIISPVTNECVYLWNVPNMFFVSLVDSVPTLLKRVADI